jgi:hypothetical protein
MALTNIPVIWAAQVLAKLRGDRLRRARRHQPQLPGRDHPGRRPRPRDRPRRPDDLRHHAERDIPAPETLTDTQAELVIDQNKGFNFQVDDLTSSSTPSASSSSCSPRQRARRLAEVADASIGAKMVLEAQRPTRSARTRRRSRSTRRSPAPPLRPARSTPTGCSSRLAVKLDKNNVPRDGRWVVLPPFMMGALSLDQRFTASVADQGRTLANGFQGRAAGFNVYTTTAVPVGNASTKYKVIAGSPLATSYAEQLSNVVFYRPERRFATPSRASTSTATRRSTRRPSPSRRSRTSPASTPSRPADRPSRSPPRGGERTSPDLKTRGPSMRYLRHVETGENRLVSDDDDKTFFALQDERLDNGRHAWVQTGAHDPAISEIEANGQNPATASCPSPTRRCPAPARSPAASRSPSPPRRPVRAASCPATSCRRAPPSSTSRAARA